MRKLVHCLSLGLVLASFAYGMVIPYDPETMSYPISHEQAEQSAQDWAGDETLQLVLAGIDISASDESFPHRYVFRSTDNDQQFDVDCRTGEMHMWFDIPACREEVRKYNEHWDESTQLPVSELNSRVSQFLELRYHDFAELNMTHAFQGEPSSMYIQVLPSGALYNGNKAYCGIDRWSGSITSYWGKHSPPPTVSPDPSVGEEQACQIALAYSSTLWLDNPDPDSEEGTVHPLCGFVLEIPDLWVADDDLGVQRLTWLVKIIVHAEIGNYTPEMYVAEQHTDLCVPSGDQVNIKVDAHTGEVVSWEPGGYLGFDPRRHDVQAIKKLNARKLAGGARMGHQLDKGSLLLDGVARSDVSYPPVAFGDTGYIYAKYLPTLYGGTIKWADGGSEIQVGGKQFTLRPGMKSIECEGEVKQLTRAPQILYGRIYIPHEAIAIITGGKADWDSKSKTLSITSSGLPLKPQFRRYVVPSANAK